MFLFAELYMGRLGMTLGWTVRGGQSCHLALDSLALLVHALPAWDTDMQKCSMQDQNKVEEMGIETHPEVDCNMDGVSHQAA